MNNEYLDGKIDSLESLLNLLVGIFFFSAICVVIGFVLCGVVLLVRDVLKNQNR